MNTPKRCLHNEMREMEQHDKLAHRSPGPSFVANFTDRHRTFRRFTATLTLLLLFLSPASRADCIVLVKARTFLHSEPRCFLCTICKVSLRDFTTWTLNKGKNNSTSASCYYALWRKWRNPRSVPLRMRVCHVPTFSHRWRLHSTRALGFPRCVCGGGGCDLSALHTSPVPDFEVRQTTRR